MNEGKYELRVEPEGEAEIVLERWLRAPLDTVWEAVTRPEHFVRWWGDRFLTDVQCDMDFRVGGKWSAVGKTPDGQPCPFRGEFLAIEPKTRLVQTEVFDIPPFNERPATNEMILTAHGAETLIRVTVRRQTPEDRDGHLASGMAEGAAASYDALERLAAEMGADPARPFRLERVFRAPLDLVWETWTQPEHIARWLGPEGSESTGFEIDLRPGGKYLYGLRLENGLELRGMWAIRRIEERSELEAVVSFVDADETIVRHPLDPHWPLRILHQVSFEPVGVDLTRVVIIWTPLDAEDAEMTAFDQGRESMTGGWGASFDGLEKTLAGPPEMIIRRRMRHSCEAVFDAWLNEASVGQWLFVEEGYVMGDVVLDKRPGGDWSMDVIGEKGVFQHRGRYLEIDRPCRLSFTFGVNEPESASIVILEISPTAEGCELVLRHQLVGDWARDIHLTRAGWTGMIEALDHMLAE